MSFNDWNNNGSHDSFDSYVDYKITNESGTSGSSNHSNDTNHNKNPKGRSDWEIIVCCFISLCLSISAMFAMIFLEWLGIFIGAGLLYAAYKVII